MSDSDITVDPASHDLWVQKRVLSYVMERRLLPRPEAISPSEEDPDLSGIDERYRDRARYLARLVSAYIRLGLLHSELRLSLEPLHPVPSDEVDSIVSKKLSELGAARVPKDHGLSLLSFGLLRAMKHPAALVKGISPAAEADDLLLYDSLSGFGLWKEDGRVRNAWIGNQRDMVELAKQPEGVRKLLVQNDPDDHMCLGKGVFLRLIYPRMRRRLGIQFDASDTPVLTMKTQRELDQFAEELSEACRLAPLTPVPLFRGQTTEHLLPDRKELVAAGICEYSNLRDHSLVPSIFRSYDRALRDLSSFRSFLCHLQDWGLKSDLVFGEPSTFLTLDGRPYVPRPVPPGALAELSISSSGALESNRAFDDAGLYSIWTVKTPDGAIVDRYRKEFRWGHSTVRRNLLLQHYGAPTAFLDVTRDIRVAQWFSLNRIRVESTGLASSGRVEAPFDDSVIYVLLAIGDLAPVVDTTELVSEVESLRPHRQSCLVIGGGGNLYRNAVARFIACKIKFSSTFIPTGLPTARHLFPGPDEDNTLKKLLDAPNPIEKLPDPFPVYWFPEGAPDS